MKVSNCRVCSGAFYEEPLLRYENMPGSAQGFLDLESLEQDKGTDLEVCQCSVCGLVQLSNEPVSYYREVIRATAISQDMTEFRLKHFFDFVKKHDLRNKKILEIGCGEGEYLSLMKECGPKVAGLEYGQGSVERGIEAGLQVERGYIDSPDYLVHGQPYDAFFIMNFFEHAPEPNVLLQGINNNLVDGAVGIIEVPNFDMILKNNLFSEFISDHLFYFTKDTLVSTLQRNGFEVLECESIWHDYIISAVVKKRERLDLTHFYNYQSKIKREILEYIGRYNPGRVAIYGAGHQSLAIISLTNIGDKVKYIIDDAPFKQNKYAPASHVPIVPIEELETNPVDAIIVMAASYSNEVSKKVITRFGYNMDLAILRDTGLERICEKYWVF
tara:strand:- start:130 stop:1287 length:1158 start_codon:yes stop_codon:yes gene_type:complete